METAPGNQCSYGRSSDCRPREHLRWLAERASIEPDSNILPLGHLIEASWKVDGDDAKATSHSIMPIIGPFQKWSSMIIRYH